MSQDMIQARYDQLDELSARFRSQAEQTVQMQRSLQRAFQNLQRNGWEGKGADAFFREMQIVIFPAVGRLHSALVTGAAVLRQIVEIMHTAEEEAARPFRTGGGAGTSTAPNAALSNAPDGDAAAQPGAAAAPAPSAAAFTPVPMESPGGGRIQDRTPPNPADIETVPGIGGKRVPLHRQAAQAWHAMEAAARADGIEPPLLLPTSGYRDPQHQERLWQAALAKYGSAAEARKWVAPPGGSAHQTGRTIDLHLGGRNSSGNVAQLRTLPAYKWLEANAERFGFYPYSREPWHWEYNPPTKR